MAKGAYPPSAVVFAEKTTETYDSHRSLIITRGVRVKCHKVVDCPSGYECYVGGAREYHYFLRKIDSEYSSILQLYVIVVFKEWAFLESAYSYGKTLDIYLIDTRASAYNVVEEIAINFTKEEIEVLAGKNVFETLIAGKRNSVEISVPGAYFRGFLDGLYKSQSSD